MITVYPSYYNEFACIADKCRHSCCIGWEIDIDGDSLRRYEVQKGPMGEALRQGIDYTGTPHFRLKEDERCFFLRPDGLCELYRQLGEGALCQICSDHPRFRTFLPGRTEVGLGLCCEEAARLILSQRERVRILRRGLSPERESREVRAGLWLRRRAMAAAQDREKPLSRRLEALERLFGRDICRDAGFWAGVFTALERLDTGWEAWLRLLTAPADTEGFRRYMAGRETEYEQLLVYFLYRHLLSGEDFDRLDTRGAFAVLSVGVLHRMAAARWTETGVFSFADQVELCRMYSSEVEYSEENLEAVFAALER